MTRGQVHTLESVIGSLVLLLALLLAFQMTAVTPLTASTSSQHIENQQKETVRGLLATADEQGSLKSAVLYYNESGGEFHELPNETSYYTDPPDNEFGRSLNRTLDREAISYNVRFRYDYADGQSTERYIYRGDPSDNAITVSRTVLLTDDDPLYDTDGTPSNETVGTSSAFYAPDRGANLYNVVKVEVVVWRI